MSRLGFDKIDGLAQPVSGNLGWSEGVAASSFSQTFGVRTFKLHFFDALPDGAIGSVGNRVIADEEIRPQLGGGERKLAANDQVADSDGEQN